MKALKPMRKLGPSWCCRRKLKAPRRLLVREPSFFEAMLSGHHKHATHHLEDGSYFRLNNMTLGYTFDTKAMGIANWLKELRLSFTGQNLLTITNYSGFDPEINQDKSVGGVQSFGIDDNGYPRARTFVFGLNVTF